MHLEEFQDRRTRLLDVLKAVDITARISPGDVEVRSTPTSKPGRTQFTVTPTDDGAWRGDSWYSEVGGTHSIRSVIATTPEKALDWAWWSCTVDFRRKFVVASEAQHDRETRRNLQSLVTIASGRSPMIARMQKESQPQWSDESTNPFLLGLASLLFARSLSPTAMRLARNPRTPSGALALMARAGVAAVQWQVAGNPATNAKVLRELHASADFGVRWYLASRDETSTSDIVAWAAEDSALWSAMLDRQDITADQLDDLDRASSGVLRAEIIAHPAVSVKFLSQLVPDCDFRLGIGLLESGRLQPGPLQLLIDRAPEWSAPGIGNLLATRRLPLDPATAERLARSTDAQSRILAAASPSLSALAVHELAADSSITVRQVLATSPALPIAALTRLGADSEALVRLATSRNKLTTGASLAELAFDVSPEVRRAAIVHSATPRAVLESLLEHPDPDTARFARAVLSARR